MSKNMTLFKAIECSKKNYWWLWVNAFTFGQMTMNIPYNFVLVLFMRRTQKIKAKYFVIRLLYMIFLLFRQLCIRLLGTIRNYLFFFLMSSHVINYSNIGGATQWLKKCQFKLWFFFCRHLLTEKMWFILQEAELKKKEN